MMLLRLLALISLVSAQNEGPLVDAPVGMIRGFYSTTRDGKDISTFLGIPYAQPPVLNSMRTRFSLMF